MHASLEQLISLRDEEPVAVEVQQHVRACADCARALNGLLHMRERLTSLVDPLPPAGVWERVSARADTGARTTRRRQWFAAGGLGLAASVVATLLLVGPQLKLSGSDSGHTTVVAEGNTAPASVSQLMAESQYLEHAMLNVNDNADRMPVSAGTASTVANIEDRIAVLDYEINQAPHGGSDPKLAQLWRQRVDLLQSLAAVRYAQVADNGI